MSRNPCISLQHRAELSHSLGMARFRIELEELPRDDGERAAFDLDNRFVQFCVGFFDTAAGEMAADIFPRFDGDEAYAVIIFCPLERRGSCRADAENVRL